MKADVAKVLIDRHAIAQRVKELAVQIAADVTGQPRQGDDAEVTLVPILTGSIIFVSDLIRHLPLRMQIRMISVSSYPGTATSSRGTSIQAALSNVPERLDGRHVLILDDILDSGRTLRSVTDLLAARNPASVKSCVLLRKRRPEAMDFPLDYHAFEIPDEFVVGYGLDFNGYYRNLPDICTLHPHVIEAAQRTEGEGA